MHDAPLDTGDDKGNSFLPGRSSQSNRKVK